MYHKKIYDICVLIYEYQSLETDHDRIYHVSSIFYFEYT